MKGSLDLEASPLDIQLTELFLGFPLGHYWKLGYSCPRPHHSLKQSVQTRQCPLMLPHKPDGIDPRLFSPLQEAGACVILCLMPVWPSVLLALSQGLEACKQHYTIFLRSIPTPVASRWALPMAGTGGD